MRFVLGGGGTGGHVVPALALADELTNRGHACCFIGNADSVESSLCSAHGYPLDEIKVHKLYRRFSKDNLLFPYYLGVSIIKSVGILKRIKPEAVICTGGFVAGPVAMAAAFLKIPLFFHESNSYPGLVTRFMARRITRVYISFSATRKHLPHAKMEHLGIPLTLKKESGFDLGTLGLDCDAPTILVSGGSQGSVAINTVIDEALPQILQLGYQLLWQTGAVSHADYARKHDRAKGVYIFAFSPLLPQMQTQADFAITRAGAMTIAELEENRVPAILIPLPTAAENHQYFNALEQQKKGVAILLQQSRLNVRSLMEGINLMAEDKEKFRDNLRKIPPNNATARIIDSILAQLTKTSETKE